MSLSFHNVLVALSSLFAVGKSVGGVSVLANQCPSFNVFEYSLLRQCPASVGVDLRCVIGLPGDVRYNSVLNCATVDDYTEATLQLLDPSEMLELVRYRDSYGRPWCMLSLLFSPECVFSAKVASVIYRVAPLFPKLKVVAVDVSTYSVGVDGLVAQYGIASTPVVTLWENGYAVYRLYDDQAKLDALVKTIRAKTDLTPTSAPPYTIDDSSTEDSSANASEANCTVEAAGDSSEPAVVGGEDAESETGATTATSLESSAASGSEDDGSSTTSSSGSSEVGEKAVQFPTEKEFLNRFRYLKSDTQFDWYFVAAVVAVAVNLGYFSMSLPIAKQFVDSVVQRFVVNRIA